MEKTETYFEIGTHCNHSLGQYVLMITRCANHKSVINSRYYDSYTSRWWLRCSLDCDKAQNDGYTTPVYDLENLIVFVTDSLTIFCAHTKASPGLTLSPSPPTPTHHQHGLRVHTRHNSNLFIRLLTSVMKISDAAFYRFQQLPWFITFKSQNPIYQPIMGTEADEHEFIF